MQYYVFFLRSSEHFMPPPPPAVKYISVLCYRYDIKVILISCF